MTQKWWISYFRGFGNSPQLARAKAILVCAGEPVYSFPPSARGPKGRSSEAIDRKDRARNEAISP